MDAEELLRGITPLAGDVTAIRTVQETRPLEEFADAYVAEVNVKSASKVIKALDSSFPRDPSQPMNHLRRFAKHNQVPEHLRPALLRDGSSPSQTIFVLISPPLPDTETLQKVLAPFVPENAVSEEGAVPLHPVRIPLQPPMTTVQADTWSKSMWPVVFNPAAPRAMVAPPPHVLSRARELIQPNAGRYLALAQQMAEVAEQSGLGRGVGAVVVDPDLEAEIEIDETDEAGNIRWADAVVAVAGDGRYSRREVGMDDPPQPGTGPNPNIQTYDADREGGPELHALMRVVELISSKRRQDGPVSATGRPCLNYLETYFMAQSDVPVSESHDSSPVPEKYQKTTETAAHAIHKESETEDVPASRIRPRSQGGYLCTDLDVYLTHEPCICCCMGLLLSRFRAVIFPRGGRMVSGGLASEPVVQPVPVETEIEAEAEAETETEGEAAADSAEDKKKGAEPAKSREYYGLHWRKELNWRALGFEFVEERPVAVRAEEGVAFHA
ncbi:hypothetical protein BO70DRAFT_329728 [Aspergillus heteromorphus CBS 117.55]|uniref:tRNA-specific adenosine-34 deaminase subunit Tad3 n=1 Tax=Aspergillus heteromorphus CBS 117.55 TaxID=1448321 RepID=A0A317X3Z9_9EURO|nr:uncharacterized protein BO70DRAFT_329728 [Aspergillus heteromorphus CBS 117.55]PWY91280.1 hypothetical protein BO70DRAFT_329728 [Aspergillus heteromorphus CBS 117.55]